MKIINRRDFLKGSIGASAMITLLNHKKSVAASDKVIIGVMGIGGRGTFLATEIAKRKDVEIAYLCDVDTRRFARVAEAVEEAQGKIPKRIQDFRKMLDDKDVDAVINATPDHWHGLGTILACQAGKDVYVEKPLSHNIWEGRKMIEAARKYKRIVQVGTQCRSAPYVRGAFEYINSGKLGDIHLIRVLNMMEHSPRVKGPEEPIPEGFDYDMWCGPAPKYPYSPGQWWFNKWDFGLGGIPDDAVHQIDLARLLINKPYPKSVYHAGGVHFFKDGREIPDTQIATYEYDGNLTMISESALWTAYMKKTPVNIRDLDQFPNWHFNGTKIEIFGTAGFMFFGRHGDGWQVYSAPGNSIEQRANILENTLVSFQHGKQSNAEHLENFVNCIRTREKPNADVEEGHLSTLLSQIANISYRVGNKKLILDPKTERFVNDDTANKYLKREYRQPWVIPEKV
jgi:predicted dehydrogenase